MAATPSLPFQTEENKRFLYFRGMSPKLPSTIVTRKFIGTSTSLQIILNQIKMSLTPTLHISSWREITLNSLREGRCSNGLCLVKNLNCPLSKLPLSISIPQVPMLLSSSTKNSHGKLSSNHQTTYLSTAFFTSLGVNRFWKNTGLMIWDNKQLWIVDKSRWKVCCILPKAKYLRNQKWRTTVMWK